METPANSRPWIKSTIRGDVDAIHGARVAFVLPDGRPADNDWIDAEVIDAGTSAQGEPQVDVRLLIGPGAHPLTEGRHIMWIELNAPPELIRWPAPGEVRVT